MVVFLYVHKQSTCSSGSALCNEFAPHSVIAEAELMVSRIQSHTHWQGLQLKGLQAAAVEVTYCTS